MPPPEPTDAETRRQELELRSLELDNRAKEQAPGERRAELRWKVLGLLVAWIATLVPVTISVWEFWEEREAKILRDATSRFENGSAIAALELTAHPRGLSILVASLRGKLDTPEEVAQARAALIALDSSAVGLEDGHRRILCEQREEGTVHLGKLAEAIDDVLPEADRDLFLAHWDVHRRLRAYLGSDGEAWREHGDAIDRVERLLATREVG